MTVNPEFIPLTPTQKRRAANATIKGYLYQFVYSLIQALTNETTRVEGIEDIDVSTPQGLQAVQVKYRESTEWSLSSIRDAIRPMLESYSSNQELFFTLFIHTKVQPQTHIPTNLTVEMLKKCLVSYTKDKKAGKRITENYYNSYKPELLKGFVSHLQIKEAGVLEDLEKEAITTLASTLHCSQSEAKILHLMRGVGYIQKVAAKKSDSERIIEKKLLIDFLNVKDIIYNVWHKELVSSELFEKEIVHKLRNLDYGKCSMQRTLYVSFKQNEVSDFVRVAELLSCSITDQGVRRLSNTLPWTIIVDGEASVLREFKQHILDKNIEFNDGHEDIEFNSKLFASEPLVQVKGKGSILSKISFSLRIVSKESILSKLRDSASCFSEDFDFGRIVAFQKIPSELKKRFEPAYLVQIENVDRSKIHELVKRVIE